MTSARRPLRHPACMMDLSRFQSTAHGHADFGGLSRVVMVRKTDQRTFAKNSKGQDPQCEVVTRETIETFRGYKTERKVTTSETRDVFNNLPTDLLESCSEPKSPIVKITARKAFPETKLKNGSAYHLPSLNTDHFENECLKTHNELRKLHGVPPLQLCKKICKVAEEWANTLATKGQVELSKNREYGENIYTMWSSTPNNIVGGKEPVENWYSEVKDYTFGREPSVLKTRHFTQLIWKDTTKLGVAFARSKGGKVFIVANYHPAGNVLGFFTDNVQPIGGFPYSPASSVSPATSTTPKPRKISFTSEFEQDCLSAHNEYRSSHGVPPLKLNRRMCKYSEEWAKVLATRGQMEHRKNSEYGENIFCSWSSGFNHNITGREPVDNWYSEMKDHPFGREPSNLKSGHFSQVVWKDSQELGVAYAKNRNGQIFVVANYSPPGNFIGSFSRNVPPVGGHKHKGLNGLSMDNSNDASPTNDEDFAKMALKVHNEYRRKHGVPELKLSDQLCFYAKEWADTMAREDHFAHRPDEKFGENIYGLWSSDCSAKISARTICKSWYDEIKDHPWGTEPRVSKSSNFTQMIWKGSLEMGISLARTKKGKIYAVANYSPRGNIIGQFISNVPRPIR